MARRRSASPLDAHTGFWLRLVSNHVSQAFAARLEAQGVTVAEWVMLRALYGAEPEAPSRLAGAMGMTKGGITKLADRLIAKGLVVRRPDPADARSQTLALTRSGERIVPELTALADANDQAIFGALNAAERKVFDAALRKLARTIGQRPFPID